MSYHPTSEESLHDLRQLADKAKSRGDSYLAVIIAGVELFISLGRETELIEFMHRFEQDIRPAVEGTPSVDELERLYGDGTNELPDA